MDARSAGFGFVNLRIGLSKDQSPAIGYHEQRSYRVERWGLPLPFATYAVLSGRTR